MARILFAWEFGANLGHLAQLVPLAERLRGRGHELIFAVSDVTRAEHTLGRRALGYLQAPVWQPRLPRPSVIPCSYSEILQHYGYLDRDGLLGMVKAWREIYRLVEPDIIVFEHAPTALLASRGFEAVRMLHGVGFCLPPRVSPLPNFRLWEAVPQERLVASDERVLENVNAVLHGLKLRRLEALHELFDADHDFLCTFPELDHYGKRAAARYYGAIFERNQGAAAAWPPRGTKNVFVYMRPHMPLFHAIAQQLSDGAYRVLWFAPDVDEDFVRRYSGAAFRLVREAVRLGEAAAQADAAVLYGGHGTVAAMLTAGVPLALFPVHVEQALVTHQAVRIGAAESALSRSGPEGVGAAIARVLGDGAYREHARAFAAKYTHFDPQRAVARIAHRIDEYCDGIRT